MADTTNLFTIVHGGDELYYQTDADFNDTLWAGLAENEPYQKLTAIGKRTDIGRAAEIQQSGNCDYDITLFDDWVTVYDLPADKICEYLEKNVEKMKMYDGTECFVIGKWTDTGIDGDIPVDYMIGAEYNFDKNDFDYYMQAHITDGDYKGYYLGGDVYDRPIIKQDAVSALTDKIAEIAVDRNEARADGWNEDEELDLTQQDRGRS